MKISQPGTKISWSLWRFEWTPKQAGESQLMVRATDGEGKLQISEYREETRPGQTIKCATARRACTACAPMS
jgi:hypothetical protein